MYSRNYGITEDQKSKITPPPDYSGSAIQSVGVTEKAANQNNEMNSEKEILSKSFTDTEDIPESAPASQNIRFTFPKEEDKPTSLYREESEQKKEEKCEDKKCILKKGSGFLSGLTVEDLILFGIIAALAFGVADNDMLVIALVIAVVIM